MLKIKSVALFILNCCLLHAVLNAQPTTLPKPSKVQLAWHEMEFYLFTHFGPNTFTGKEWGHGDEPEDIFNPGQLDCNQWARIAKAAGAKGIIITAKHHDGFCLWPSAYSNHTVRESKWKDGKGDVLRELANACKKYNLKFGVYISPWDRNHPDYGTDKYNEVYINTMKEIFRRYSPIWELWWDGANGEGPNGKKQEYDFPRFERTMQALSPSTVIFSDIGPHIRWVGNEKGIAGDPNWNYLDTEGFKRGNGAPATDTLNHGNYNGKYWIPAECDVSIRPGWFYHQEEDSKVKSPEVLFDLFLKSVGRGANLLLNVPPDTRGLIHANDSIALMQFKKLRDESFKNNVLAGSRMEFKSNGIEYNMTNMLFQKKYSISGAETDQIKIVLQKPVILNCIELKEALQDGQHIRNFKVDLYDSTQLMHSISGSSIGRKRILTFPEIKVSSFTFSINPTTGHEKISSIKAYYMVNTLIEKIKSN